MAPHATRTLGAPDPMYPCSDGKPMAENTEQAKWIVLFGENFRSILADHFVATDLLWYPAEGKPKICAAPDTLIALGRPPGPRLSYMTWREGGVNPQVVIEVWSPSNDAADKAKRLRFFEAHGVQEVYAYDPDAAQLTVWWRGDDGLAEVPVVGSVVSPLTGVRFEPGKPELRVYRPDGTRFRHFSEIEAERDAERDARRKAQVALSNERRRAVRARAKAGEAQSKVEAANAQAEQANAKAEAANAKAEAANAMAEAANAMAAREREQAALERARAEALLARLREAGLAD
jgi:Uma2 family endonuclease